MNKFIFNNMGSYSYIFLKNKQPWFFIHNVDVLEPRFLAISDSVDIDLQEGYFLCNEDIDIMFYYANKVVYKDFYPDTQLSDAVEYMVERYGLPWPKCTITSDTDHDCKQIIADWGPFALEKVLDGHDMYLTGLSTLYFERRGSFFLIDKKQSLGLYHEVTPEVICSLRDKFIWLNS